MGCQDGDVVGVLPIFFFFSRTHLRNMVLRCWYGFSPNKKINSMNIFSYGGYPSLCRFLSRFQGFFDDFSPQTTPRLGLCNNVYSGQNQGIRRLHQLLANFASKVPTMWSLTGSPSSDNPTTLFRAKIFFWSRAFGICRPSRSMKETWTLMYRREMPRERYMFISCGRHCTF